jgi:hypothetical protein
MQTMNPFKSLVDGRSRRASRSSLRFESLEQRLPLAGNVVAELIGSTLRITGDSMGNEVVVASAAGGKIAVIGQNTTINGSSGTFVTNKAVTSIIANLNGGNDAIGFGNSAQDYADERVGLDVTRFQLEDSPPAPFDVAALQTAIDNAAGGVTTFSIRGSLTVATADGDDAIGISGNVGGSVNVNLGSADDCNGLVIGAESAASRIGGAVTVVGGRKNDIFAIGNVTVAGRVSADLGDGSNVMAVAGEATAPTIVGSLAYSGGANTDDVWIAGKVTVQNDVVIYTGLQGEDSVICAGADAGNAMTVLGNVVVNTGTGRDDDSVVLAGDIRRTVSVTTGGGQDSVLVSYPLVGAGGLSEIPSAMPSAIGLDLTINTGAGNDLVSIGPSTVGRNATIDAGSGDDDVRIDTMQVRRSLFIRLGAGDDALTLTNLRAFSAFLDGGTGSNVLSMDATTPVATRRHRIYRFQAVSNV